MFIQGKVDMTAPPSYTYSLWDGVYAYFSERNIASNPLQHIYTYFGKGLHVYLGEVDMDFPPPSYIYLLWDGLYAWLSEVDMDQNPFIHIMIGEGGDMCLP